MCLKFTRDWHVNIFYIFTCTCSNLLRNGAGRRWLNCNTVTPQKFVMLAHSNQLANSSLTGNRLDQNTMSLPVLVAGTVIVVCALAPAKEQNSGIPHYTNIAIRKWHLHSWLQLAATANEMPKVGGRQVCLHIRWTDEDGRINDGNNLSAVLCYGKVSSVKQM